MSARWQFRRAQESDVPAIRRIHEAGIREVCAQDYPAAVIAQWLGGIREERYRRRIGGQSFWMMEDGGRVIGFGCVWIEKSTLESLFLEPAERGAGAATALLAHLESIAAGAGIAELRLDSSLSAQAFYARRGYRACSAPTSIRLESGLELAGIPMIKTLPAAAPGAGA